MRKSFKIMGIAIFLILFLTGCKGELVLEDVPVEFKGYNKEEYVVDGANSKVDVVITGEQKVLDKIESSKNNKVILDLEDYVIPETGKYFSYKFETDVKDEYESVRITPYGASVTLAEKSSKTIELEPKVLNLDKIDSKLGIKSVLLSKYEIIIKGSKHAIKKVEYAEAEINLESLNVTGVKNYTYYDAAIKLYDKNYNEVTDVELVPSKVNAIVSIVEGESTFESYSSKTVPVNFTFSGNMKTGVAIADATIDGVPYSQYTVQIEGKGIEDINSLDLVVNTSELSAYDTDKAFVVELDLPSGVKKVTRKGKSVHHVMVLVDGAAAKQKTIANLPIMVKNVPDGKVVNVANVLDSKSDALVIASDSNISKVKAEDIELYIDLEGYNSGTYYVSVLAESNNPLLQITPTKKSIKVVISNK